MAKLSARGRTEEWRLAKDTEFGKVKYALMSDGKILKTSGRTWKVAKIKLGLSNEQVKEILLSKGYQEVKR